jgi:pimeloyl-ACP methyl ester carboxylesterase
MTFCDRRAIASAWVNATLSLEDDVAVTNRVLSAQDGPTVLVGHSYGGAVISQAGTHDQVAAPVYITAFAPDKGNPSRACSRIYPPEPQFLRSSHPKTASCSSTATSSLSRLPGISRVRKPSSWPIPRCPGASRHWAASSPIRPGGPSRAGTSS